MRKGSLLVIVALFSIYLNGGAQAQSRSALSGVVLSDDAKAVSRATVRLLNRERSVITGGDGSFSFADLEVGKYSLEVTASEYATSITDVEVGAGMAPLIITLQPISRQLDAVTVSAQKQEERAQRVPLSVTTISERSVAALRLWSAQELTAVVPNLYSGNSGDERNVTSIRGITTTSFDPAVTTYVDGVSQFNLDTYMPQLFGIERIEVLRGPQGTLYGRNALGGVINIITKAPRNETSGFVEATRGSFDQQRYTAGVSAPIVKNKLFFGMSGLFHKREGYYTNEFTQTSFDRQHGFTGNYYLRYRPADRWSLTLNVKHQHNWNSGAFPLVNGKEAAFEKPYILSQNKIADMVDRTANASLSLSHNARRFNLSTQAAWQSNYRFYEEALDADFSPLDAVSLYNNFGKPWNRVQVFTHELRISSPAAKASPWNWVAGSYLYNQVSPVKVGTLFGKDAGALGVPDTDFFTITTSESRSRGGALFGQVTYTLDNNLSFTGGLRGEIERKALDVRGEYQKVNEPTFVTTPDTSGSAHYASLAPKLGMSYQWGANALAYAQYSKGYRSGGLTQLSGDPSQPPLFPYDPEHSHNFEVGFKQAWLQDRVRLSTSLFLTSVNDIQVPTLVLPEAITVTRNNGKLQSKGAELELVAQPIEGLMMQYNGGIVDASYRSLALAQEGEVVNRKGARQLFTPENTSFLALQYSLPISVRGGLHFTIRGEWLHLGKQYFDLANNIEQSAYSRFNTRAGFSTKSFELFFWGRNLGDKAYIEYAYDFGGVHLGAPRTMGVTARANF